MAKIDFDNHWYPFHYFRFGSKTARWSAERVGAYVNLLNYQWAYNGLPDDKEELLEIANCSAETLDKVLKEFSIKRANKIFNEELEVLRKIQIAKYEKRANAGRKGGTAKKQSLSNAKAMVEQSLSNEVATEQNKTEQNREEQIAYNTEANKEEAKASKKKLSLEEYRLLVDEAISKCSFTDKFTQEAIGYFKSWAKTENKITALRKIKSELPQYFQKEIDYLSKKYAPNQIEYMLELADRKCYVSYVENNIPEPKKIIQPQFEERYSITTPPPPPTVHTKTAEELEEEALRIIDGK